MSKYPYDDSDYLEPDSKSSPYDDESSPYNVGTRNLSNHPYLKTRQQLNQRDAGLLRVFEKSMQNYLARKSIEINEEIKANIKQIAIDTNAQHLKINEPIEYTVNKYVIRPLQEYLNLESEFAEEEKATRGHTPEPQGFRPKYYYARMPNSPGSYGGKSKRRCTKRRSNKRKKYSRRR